MSIIYNDKVGYSVRYDATFDLKTREWIEPKCSMALCHHCKDRPENASDIPSNDPSSARHNRKRSL